MSPAQHDDLQALLAHASAAMRAAAIEVESMPDGEARDRYLRQFASLLANATEIDREEAFKICPALRSSVAESEGPAESVSEHFTESLAAADIETIDAAIVSNCSHSKELAARAIGMALTALPPELRDLPLDFFQGRIPILVRAGRLRAEGNLGQMRSCNIWLP